MFSEACAPQPSPPSRHLSPPCPTVGFLSTTSCISLRALTQPSTSSLPRAGWVLESHQTQPQLPSMAKQASTTSAPSELKHDSACLGKGSPASLQQQMQRDSWPGMTYMPLLVAAGPKNSASGAAAKCLSSCQVYVKVKLS